MVPGVDPAPHSMVSLTGVQVWTPGPQFLPVPQPWAKLSMRTHKAQGHCPGRAVLSIKGVRTLKGQRSLAGKAEAE
jgi:hypothetical protein